ncbi:carbonyl reductase 2 [Penicillium chermesinum]|uniref:Carbonyl reductase 2 n=1 Tax=Penicillium chermesinum TaxID=63820 RepID=A0A9W9NHJ4_9EURO|nr:carbonyl reductase 2 [Penicillium chermesinum]KAJ5220154.1 carbonyl reductase 2 [Penicillium chermesinum]
MSEFDQLSNVKGTAFTHQCYTQPYPAITPTRPELAQTVKVIVITGVTREIGQKVVINSITPIEFYAQDVLYCRKLSSDPRDEGTGLRNFIRTGQPRCHCAHWPLNAAGNKAFQEITAELGVPQVLINNAGVAGPVKPNLKASVEEWWNTLVVNVKAIFTVTKAFVKETGATPAKQTTIISITSMPSQGVPPVLGPYSTSNAAVNKFTAYLNSEYPNINSFVLDPGVVRTDTTLDVPYLMPYANDSPLLPGGTAVWLSSGDKKYLSGRYIMSSWNVKEIEARKGETHECNLLTFALKGEFGLGNIKVD